MRTAAPRKWKRSPKTASGSRAPVSDPRREVIELLSIEEVEMLQAQGFALPIGVKREEKAAARERRKFLRVIEGRWLDLERV